MKWIFPEEKNDLDIITQLLEQRGIKDKEKFLNPASEHIHDSALLFGATDSAKIIKQAIEDEKRIVIHGDFDVDGVTATAIMWKFLYYDLGAKVMPFIPNRFDHGYGLTQESLTQIKKMGCDLLISVDCGIKDLEMIDQFKDDFEFIITDHHSPIKKDVENLDEISEVVNGYRISKFAKTTVHPKLNEDYPFNEICGAVVSWKVCLELNKLYENKYDIDSFIDLAAFGTVCDVMPLIDENRAIVKLGLEQMQKTNHIGLLKLIEQASVDVNDLKSYHFGYVLGPRINAAGRVSDATEALRLLATDKEHVAKQLALNLNSLNIKRQELTKKYLDLALEQISNQSKSPIHIVHGEKWPEGILGLIAGRLCNDLNKPVLVASKSGEIMKGSARSIEDVNIVDILNANSEHLTRYGGHAQAAGFQLPYSTLEEFKIGLSNFFAENHKNLDTTPKLRIDSVIGLDNLNLDFYYNLQQLEPFGELNNEPIFALTNLKLIDKKIIGSKQNHAKYVFSDGNNEIEALQFNFNKYSTTPSDIDFDSIIDLAGNLDLNEWNGNKKLQIKIVDLRTGNQ